MQINTNIHCLATGKIIAEVSDDEFGVILAATAHIPAAQKQAHMDRLTLLSMRPSLAWMSVTPESLNAMREAAPRELLAYLLNRLYAHVETDKKTGKPLNSESMLAARRMRIQLWETIEATHFDSEELDQLLLVLLELDSRFGLAKLVKPTTVTSMWSADNFVNLKALIGQLILWKDTLVVAQVRADKQAAYAREFWSEGNRLTRSAFAQQFVKVKPHTPLVSKSANAVERRAKAARIQEDVDFLDQLEAELTTRSAAGPIKFAEVAAPKKITRFGVKKEA